MVYIKNKKLNELIEEVGNNGDSAIVIDSLEKVNVLSNNITLKEFNSLSILPYRRQYHNYRELILENIVAKILNEKDNIESFVYCSTYEKTRFLNDLNVNLISTKKDFLEYLKRMYYVCIERARIEKVFKKDSEKYFETHNIVLVIEETKDFLTYKENDLEDKKIVEEIQGLLATLLCVSGHKGLKYIYSSDSDLKSESGLNGDISSYTYYKIVTKEDWL